MYLSDNELQALLPDLAIKTENPKHVFDADLQLQPASIDLRVSNVFWKLRRGTRLPPVNLGPSHFRTVHPRRHWRRQVLGEGDAISLAPGEMVLASVYEHLTMPSDCAGHITGRSSFARMGLMVHATGDFINPGWSGHMPLTLINTSRSTLQIPPYLSICQLIVVRLSSTPSRLYGAVKLNSKYVDDDGGPSFWWRDQTLSAISQNLQARGGLEEAILRRIGPPSDDVLNELDRFLASKASHNLNTSDEVLHRFAELEDRRELRDKIIKGIMIGPFPILTAGTVGAFFTDGLVNASHIVLWTANAVAGPVALFGYKRRSRTYFGQADLDSRDRALNPSHAPSN